MTSTATIAPAEPAQDAAERWVAAFAEGWRAPSDADTFCDHFDPWLSEDVRMVQPQLPTLVGKAEFRERFARPLFSLLSDVRGTVGSWAAAGDVVFIELTIRGRVGGREVALRTIDKITLRDGLAVERIAGLDPTPLLAAVARSPRSWPRFARMQASTVLAAIRGR